MDRFYFGLTQYGADGFPKQPLPLAERHKREDAEMDARLEAAIEHYGKTCYDDYADDTVAEAKHQLREAIAEKVALELEHHFEWNR